MKKCNSILSTATAHWKYVAPILAYPKSEKEYEKLINMIDELLDIIGEDESHPLMGLIDVMSQLVNSYEEVNIKQKNIKGVEALKLLMEINKLTQSDFSEIASQGVMSEILKGKRMLNIRQVKLLAKKFKVAPSTFID